MTMEAMINLEDTVRMVNSSRKSSRKFVHRNRVYSPQDLMAFEHMSMRDPGNMGTSLPRFVGQHEPESAEASGIVEYP